MPNSHDPQVDLDRITSTLRTRYWCWTVLDPAAGPRSLLGLLRQMLPHIPEESWAERFDFGGVYVNGREALADAELPVPCKVEYYEPKFPIRDAAALFPHFSLKKSLETLLGVTIHMPSRLDVSARGLVLVSISPRAHAPVQQAFESRRVIKRYLCATKNECACDRKVERGLIGRDPRHPVLRISPATEGQSAETIFTNLGKGVSSGEVVAILCAQPVTGRTHQIRVHAAANHVPLYGDMFYGGASAAYLHLASAYISFEHPLHARRIELALPERFQADWMRSSIHKLSSL